MIKQVKSPNEFVVKVGGPIAAIFYAAIGLLLYLLFGEYEVFSWVDPWVYVYIGLWPFLVFWWFILIAICIIGLVLIGSLISDWYNKRFKKARKPFR